MAKSAFVPEMKPLPTMRGELPMMQSGTPDGAIARD
jgi:hypothetical protein